MNEVVADSVVEGAVVPTVETKAEVIVTKAQERSIDLIVKTFIETIPAYVQRKTNSTTFRCMTVKENENVNWRKGLVYLTARYSKGVNLEFWLYSTKGGVHLMEHNETFRKLATGEIKCEPCGKAVKLRIQLPDSLSDEEVVAKIKSFTDAIEPTVTEVRAKVPAVVSKKETAEAAKKATATATVPEVKDEVVAPTETPAEVPAEVPAETPVETPVVEAPKNNKKNGKKK